MKFRRFRDDDFEAVVGITLVAFAPIHESFRDILGARIFDLAYPDWKQSNREYLEFLRKGKDRENIVVAEDDGAVIGFLSYFVNPKKKSGELGLNCVHPMHQRKGVGTRMYKHVLKEMKARGVKLVVVGTGGDRSHLPAKRAYQKCGFVALPLVKYYKAL